MRSSAAPFGHNASKEAKYSDGKLTGFDEWELDVLENPKQLTLSARNDKILPGSWAVVEQFVFDSVRGATRRWIFSSVGQVTHLSVARYGIAGSATLLSFGEDAWIKLGNSLALLRTMTVAVQSEALGIAALPPGK
jgi:hypothetical protein